MKPADILAAFRAWKDERSSVSAEFDLECEREFARRYIAARLAAVAPDAPPPLRPNVPEWLRPHVDKLGVIKDCEVAALCGVRSGLVGMWRQRLGIGRWHAGAAYFRRSVLGGNKPSALDALTEHFGVLPDAKIATMAGLTYSALVAYRRTHPDLPRSPQSRRGDRS